MDSTDTARILAEAYQITALTLRKLGEYELAWLAGDRGVALAERTGDPVLAAVTGFRVAIALTSLGRADFAFNLIAHTHTGLSLDCAREAIVPFTGIFFCKRRWPQQAAGMP